MIVKYITKLTGYREGGASREVHSIDAYVRLRNNDSTFTLRS